METRRDTTAPLSPLLSAEPMRALRANWQPALRDSYEDAEHALQATIELALRAHEGDSGALVSLGTALALVMARLEAHHEILEHEGPRSWGKPDAVVKRHVAYFRKRQLGHIDNLMAMLNKAPSPSALAQAVTVSGIVMLQDWYAHGRLLVTLAEPPLSTFS